MTDNDLDEAIEAACRAAVTACYDHLPSDMAHVSRALVTALEEHGFVLVPKRQTADMVYVSDEDYDATLAARPRPSCMREPEPGNAEAVFEAAERVHEVAVEEDSPGPPEAPSEKERVQQERIEALEETIAAARDALRVADTALAQQELEVGR